MNMKEDNYCLHLVFTETLHLLCCCPVSHPLNHPPFPSFSQTPVPFIKPLHVVFARGGGIVAVVLGGSTRAARLGPAEAAEQTSSQKEQHTSPPPHKDTRSQLLLLTGSYQGVVEISYNIVGGPADRDDHQDASQQQADPRHQADLGLGVFVLHTGGEVSTAEQDQEAEAADHAADDGQGTGSLHVRRQHQQGVVVLALLLAGTLHHTGRPQALLTALLTQTDRKRKDQSLQTSFTTSAM